MTGNPRAFRALVRNALFRRVELVALRRYDELGALDEQAGWDAAAWAEAMEPYFAEHGELGTGADARGPGLLIINELPGHWEVRQIFDDPAGDHDWGISAVVDLAPPPTGLAKPPLTSPTSASSSGPTTCGRGGATGIYERFWPVCSWVVTCAPRQGSLD